MALISEQNSMILVIDIQGKLAPAIAQADTIITANQWLLKVATELAIPIFFTEQYPKGLGHTVIELADWQTPTNTLTKSHFSAWQETHIRNTIAKLGRAQIVVTGTESHVCVLQTVLDLLRAGYQVFVVEEAVGSRQASSKALALARMQQAGAVIVNNEMVAFEWLHDSASERFKHISRSYIR